MYTAETRATRRRGLAGLAALDAATGLWLTPCRSIHTFGMRFDLDLLWLDREDQVMSVDRAVSPRRLRTRLRARSVIEVAAGQGTLFAAAWPQRR